METKQTGRHSRLKTRLHRLREHHEECLAKHMEYTDSQTQESSSDSACTCIPESSRSDTSDDPDVPPLRRTDSVLLTKEYLKQMSRVSDGSEASISCVESSGDEYIPPKDSTDEAGSSSSSSKKRRQPESDSDDYQPETSKKRSWTEIEVRAVEKTLKSFIDSGKLPRKSDCVACIKASPGALKNRRWTAVKFYVKNRITAIRRERAKRVF